MAFHALFLVGSLAAVPAGVADVREIPLPEIEQASCAIDPRIGVERWTMQVRNVHTVPLVAFTIRLTDPQKPTVKRLSFTDRVMNPRRAIQPGESVDHSTSASCSVTAAVAASVYDDGTFSGNNNDVEAIFQRRQARLRALRRMLSVLQTTSAGEAGVNGAAELQALLESLAGSREGLVGLDAVSNMENRPDIFDAMKNEYLSKEMLIQALELGVSILERAVVPRRLPDWLARSELGVDSTGRWWDSRPRTTEDWRGGTNRGPGGPTPSVVWAARRSSPPTRSDIRNPVTA